MVFCDWFLSVSILFSSFTHVVFTAEQYSIVWKDHILFIHSSADGHLGFHVLAIVIRVVRNICAHVFAWTYVFIAVSRVLILWGEGNRGIEIDEGERETKTGRHHKATLSHSHTQAHRDAHGERHTKTDMDTQRDALIHT